MAACYGAARRRVGACLHLQRHRDRTPALCDARLHHAILKAAGERDELTTLGAWRRSASQSTFACETEIYDQHKELLATGAGTFLHLKGERIDGMLTFARN